MWLLWFLMCFPWRPRMTWNLHDIRMWWFKLIWTIYFCVSLKVLYTTLTLLFLPLIIIYQGHGLCGPSCSSQSYSSILSTNHKATLYTQKSPVCCEFVSMVFPICLCFSRVFPPYVGGGVTGLLLNLSNTKTCSALFLHISPVLVFLGQSCTFSYLLDSHVKPKLWRHAHYT